MNHPHLVEPIRVKIAQNYLRQEFRKIFNHREEEGLHISVGHLTPNQMGYRDFWNTVWGIAMGYKLKVTLVDVITAENIHWKFVNKFSVDNLQTGSGLPYIDKSLKGPQSYTDLTKYFESNPEQSKLWKNKLQKDYDREKDAIICEEKKNGYSIHDGNRRFILACINKISDLNAYVGQYTTKDKSPINYWVSTPVLIEIVHHLIKSEMDGVHDSFVEVIRTILSKSEVGKDEFLQRVVSREGKFYKELKAEIGTSL